MAKGSVRKKGKKWYYRFYVEDESGNLVQKECAGTESKSETEALLRKAMEDYEAKKFVAKSENVTVGNLLDMWVEEELKPGNLANGTVMAYQGAVGRIKQFPIGSRKLKTVTSEHLQAFFDLLSFGGTNADGTEVKPISKGYMRQFSAVMQGAFRFAVFPKRLLTFNPMQYIKIRQKQESYEVVQRRQRGRADRPHDLLRAVQGADGLSEKERESGAPAHPDRLLHRASDRRGLRLTWQDIDLKEQTITVRRSMRYNGARHKTEVGTTKRSKIRTVDFCDTLAAILKAARTEQHKNRFKYGELYSLNYYKQVQEKGRSYYELYSLQRSEEVPEDYREIDFVCLRPDGCFESSSTVSIVCRTASKKVPGLRASTSISFATRSRATCSPTGQLRRTYRSFWDTPTSVPP
jgi:hypothetical protein